MIDNEYLRQYRSYANINGVWEYFNSPVKQRISSVAYRDIHGNGEKNFIEVPFCTWSDYSGSTVERSNCRTFLDRFKEHNEKDMWRMYGGYSTTGILITTKLYNSNQEVREVIDALFDYPVIDEDDWYMLESEIEEESWDSFIKQDVINSLNSQGLMVENDDELRQHFYRAMVMANEEFLFDDAVSAYIDIDKVLSAWEKTEG